MVISETGSNAVALRRESSSSTRTRSSRTRSKISLAVSSAIWFLLAPLESCDRTAAASRCSSRNFWRPDKIEEAPKICCCGGGEFFRRQVSHIRERARHFPDIGRLVAFAAVCLRSEKGRIGFDQHAFQRNVAGYIPDVLRLRIRRVACKRNHETGIQSTARLLQRSCKAVQYPT